MPLTPHAERADIDEGDIRVAVVARGHGREEMIELLKEDGIEVIGVPGWAPRVRTLAELEVDPFRAGVLHPLRRGVAQPALRAAHAKGDLLALGDPPLGRRVQQRPVELAFLRLQERPGDRR